MKDKRIKTALMLIAGIVLALAIIVGLTSTLEWRDMAPGDETLIQTIIAISIT